MLISRNCIFIQEQLDLQKLFFTHRNQRCGSANTLKKEAGSGSKLGSD